MQIAGIQKLTLVDFPGHVAATVFTRGCSFRCGFCHNPELVLPEKFNPLLSEAQIFEFLESRYGKLTGICITGGEPLMNSDADKFISHLRALGFDVKLDTNGSFPDRLEKIIKDGDVDYIAMDIKNSLSKYAQTVIPNSKFSTDPSASLGMTEKLSISNQITNSNSQVKNVIPSHSEPAVGRIEEGEKSQHSEEKLLANVKRSIKLILDSEVDYEFRTTVSHPIHDLADFEEMGKMIEGAKRFFLQNYKKSKRINEKIEYEPFTDDELEKAKKIMEKYVREVGIR
jgi:pyruvate formate lyase activating enzyme